MSGWGDAGELIAEGVDWVCDKHYDKVHDGAVRNIHWTGDQIRRARKKPVRHDKDGNLLPPDQQPPLKPNSDSPQRSHGSDTDGYGQPTNEYSSRRFSEDDRARDLSAQGQSFGGQATHYDNSRSLHSPVAPATSRGLSEAMGDNGYGPADYGRDPRGSNGYDDGYEGGDASDYRRAYRPERPQPYDPSRYVPHAAAGATAAASQYAQQQPQSGQRYLPPATGGAQRPYDDPYDDNDDDYDSDDSYDRRRRARKSKSETGLRRWSSRGSSRSRGARSERDRDGGSDDEGDDRKGPKHKMAATIGGALVGALAGYEISNRKGKPETFHTIAGAIVGAVGAREADKWIENRRDEKRGHERRERDADDKESRHSDRYQF